MSRYIYPTTQTYMHSTREGWRQLVRSRRSDFVERFASWH